MTFRLNLAGLLAAGLLSLPVVSSAQTSFTAVAFDALKLKPVKPGATNRMLLEYDQQLSPLIGEKKVEGVYYLLTEKGPEARELKLSKKGSLYAGELLLLPDAAGVIVSFSNGAGVVDNNGKEGYLFPVNLVENKPKADFFMMSSQMFSGFGDFLVKLPAQSDKALSYLEKGLTAYPEKRMGDIKYMNSYWQALMGVKKKEAEPIVTAQLEAFAAKQHITENEYNTLVQWYRRFKMKQPADSLTEVMKKTYPDGGWKKSELTNKFYREAKAGVKQELLDTYMKQYPVKNKEEERSLSQLRSELAAAFAKEKQTDKFMETAALLPAGPRASLYNNIAWDWAEKKENLEQAKKISYEATTWAKGEITKPSDEKPGMLTPEKWLAGRKSNFAMYADTYAFLLYQLGEYADGMKYAKEGIAALPRKDPEYMERYIMLLEKTAGAAMVKKEAGDLVKEGLSTPKIKDILKAAWQNEKGSAEGYEAYLSGLENAAGEKKAAELRKSILNESSPRFSLQNMEGKEVSLESLKGKVVVVDFWATWCGPCLASFPGMKKAVEKMKNDPEVAFVFINTWQSEADKKKEVTQFLEKTKYPFEVLMDMEDKVVADFKVSGIPTKFIIDKEGVIRFKSVGFQGSEDELVKELELMIAMAKAGKG